ncbi:MAG TPA: quinolinate synthase NadA [Segeticoccus sp.]|nr:quinolinate synthase NadA [Segeticoccus sp.]
MTGTEVLESRARVAAAVEATREVYARVAHVVPEAEWTVFAEDVVAIERLKAEKDAVVLAHNYQTPEIFHGVADLVGDSLALARQAQTVEASTIVLAGVPFMAETAKLLNPAKTVLVPDAGAGCSLADGITADDVLALRAEHPGVPVVTYVNSTAAVKAVSDICCTSGNVEKVVASLGTRRVILIPDEFLARNVADRTGIEVITWPGRCEVHERFSAGDIRQLRRDHPGVTVLAHPECPPSVVAEADLAGSTAQMGAYVSEHRPRTVALITECSMSDNIAATHPELELIRPCNLCPHMKRSTLAGIRAALESGRPEVGVDPAVAPGARRAIEQMLELL